MASIERQRETLRGSPHISEPWPAYKGRKHATVGDVIALNVIEAVHALPIRCIITPTRSGNTPRSMSRFKPACWIFAFTPHAFIHKFLTLSYGVRSFLLEPPETQEPEGIMAALNARGLARPGDTVIITEGVSSGQTGWTNSLKILSL